MKTPGRSLKLLVTAALAAAGIAVGGGATAMTINVNFGNDAGDAMNGKSFIYDSGSGPYQQAPSFYPGTTWNDHIGASVTDHTSEPGASFTQTNALDSEGNLTAVGYTTASATTQYDLEGPFTWFDHPNATMLNGGVHRVWNSGSGNAAYPEHNRLTISGLDPAKVYNIYLASSQSPDVKCSWWVGTSGTQQFIDNTSTVRTSETWRPGDNWTVFYAVAPDAGGTIDVRGRGEAETLGGAFSGLTLNGFQIVDATGWLNPDKSIYDFGDPANNPGTSSVISDNNTGDDITWTVLFSANFAALSPTFTLADNATCLPASGSVRDFSGGPVDYVVTAQDGSTRTYHVTAVPGPASSAGELLSITAAADPFAFSAISGTDVTFYVSPGTPLNAITPTIAVSPFATVSPLSGETRDFSGAPVVYTVTAEDGVTSTAYTVTAVHLTPLTIPTGTTYTIDASNTTDDGLVTTWNELGPVTIENDATLQSQPPQDAEVANNAGINFAGTGGTINLRFNNNDTIFTMNGPMVSTATGPQTLAVFTGANGNGDRESVIFNSGIPDVGDASPMSLQVTYQCQTASQSYVSLPADNTFTGPITLVKGANVASSYLTVGGVRTNAGSTPGTGTLGGGSYPGDISLGETTTFDYLSSASQTLSGAISGVGSVAVGGGGTVTLSGPDTHRGNTTVAGGSTLVLADGGGMTFYLTDASVNTITGAGTANLDGDFTIDSSAVTAAASSASWTLVDTATMSFGPTFTVAGFSEAADVWTKVEGIRTWTFTEADGVLSVSSLGVFTSFGIPGGTAFIDQALLTIRLYVPKGTDFTTLAPEFTLTSGTCDQTSGAAPSPDFGAANPVHYIVTDTSSDPDTVNDYTVTVALITNIINVSIEEPSPTPVVPDPATLEGPAGGLGEVWNQVFSNAASALLDSEGVVSGVGFSSTNMNGPWRWGGAPSLGLIWSGGAKFDTSPASSQQVVINGLTPGDYYDVWLASANLNTGQRSQGEWSTPNPTFTLGDQTADNTTELIGDMWVEGNNYVRFQYVEADAGGEIVFDGHPRRDSIYDTRLPLNGFQLVPTTAPLALITSFGFAGSEGVIDQNAGTIALEVPFGTNLATLAPDFTLFSGTCDQTSGAVPSPSFAAANPVHYVVTDTTTDPDTVRDYTVTVTVLPAVGTIVIDLGAGTVIEGGTFGTYGATNLPLPSLPVGSILRSIVVDTVLQATDNENFASDLAVLLDPTPETPGGDFSVGITNGDLGFGATLLLDWPAEANTDPVSPLADTKTDADWSAAGPIDLGTTGLFLGNAFGGPSVGGTWSGTITLTYDIAGGGTDYGTWAAGYLPADVSDPNADLDRDGLSNDEERLFALDPTSAASLNPISVPLDSATGTFSYTRRNPALSGAVYTIWTSPDLQNWTQDTGAIQDDGGAVTDVQTVAVTLSAGLLNAPKLFVQVRAHEGGSDYDTWAAGYLPADVSDPGADLDRDGLSNDEERLFALNPTSAASLNPISVPLDFATGTFSYTRRNPALSGAVYTVWTSPDLQNWTQDTGAIQDDGGAVANVQTVAVTLSAGLLTGTDLFVQVRAN